MNSFNECKIGNFLKQTMKKKTLKKQNHKDGSGRWYKIDMKK